MVQQSFPGNIRGGWTHTGRRGVQLLLWDQLLRGEQLLWCAQLLWRDERAAAAGQAGQGATAGALAGQLAATLAFYTD